MGGKGFYTVRVGKKSTDERVGTRIQQQNGRTNRLLLHTTNCCCCAVPSLLLKPGNTFGSGSRIAGRGAGPPCSSRYSHNCGNCVIHTSSVEAMDTRAAVVSVCFSDALDFSSYPFRLLSQETAHKNIGSVSFYTSRYCTRAYHVWRYLTAI